MNQKKFLTGEWRKLIMANYAVDPSILNNYLPFKTELDFCILGRRNLGKQLILR